MVSGVDDMGVGIGLLLLCLEFILCLSSHRLVVIPNHFYCLLVLATEVPQDPVPDDVQILPVVHAPHEIKQEGFIFQTYLEIIFIRLRLARFL